MKKILACASIALMLLCVLGCSKKKEKRIAPSESEFSQGSGSSQDEEEIINWTNEQGVIGVLFGYGFNDKSKISNLYSHLKDVDLRGLILLGAPDGTHLQLAKFMDADGGRTFPVFSFFPQDDVLGQECTCDFVLEYERNAQEQVDSTEVEHKIDKDAEEIAFKAVRYMALLNGPLPMNDQLRDHIQNIVGDKQIKRYVDHDTGIQSMNHYVLEQK